MKGEKKKLFKKICTIILFLYCSLFVIGNIKLNAAAVVPTDYTDIFANSTIDITDNMDDNFGVFRFNNFGSRFVEISLVATSDSSVSYPSGSIQVKNAEYRLIKKCDIQGYQSNAMNQNNQNKFTVYLANSGYHYLEINYDMTEITKLEVSINIVASTNTINLFDYGQSEEFTINPLVNSNSLDKIIQIDIKQSGQYEISLTNSSQQNSLYRHVLLRKETNNSEDYLIVKKNINISSNVSYTINLEKGFYYIGYFDSSETNIISISMTRKITQFGSYHLVPDPDRWTPCGSQIDLQERNVDINNKSYRQTNITEGFTRLIYLDSSAPSTSRLDYDWYSSDEDIAKITDYGTVLALPINVYQKTVRIMAVYKYDMSKTFVKEFTVVKDNDTYASNPIDININMEIAPMHYTYIDLSKADVPINMLQYYSWISTTNVSVDGWGRLLANNNALGTTVNIVGTYMYNPKVKIKVSVNTLIDVRFLAYNDGYVNRDLYFTPTANIIKNVRTSNIETKYYTSCSNDELINWLETCRLFFIHTHGEQNGIYRGNGILNSADLASVDLINLQMALLLTCNTGDGGYSQSRVDANSPINIVERMVACGAETVVGFNDVTYVRDCNIFAPDFARQTMNNHLSVQDAIDSIDYSSYYKNMSSIAVIGGNAENEIWN